MTQNFSHFAQGRQPSGSHENRNCVAFQEVVRTQDETQCYAWVSNLHWAPSLGLAKAESLGISEGFINDNIRNGHDEVRSNSLLFSQHHIYYLTSDLRYLTTWLLTPHHLLPESVDRAETFVFCTAWFEFQVCYLFAVWNSSC